MKSKPVMSILILVLISIIFISGCVRLEREGPEGIMTVSELLENPVYDTEVRIYGKVSLLGEVLPVCFNLTSGGEEVEPWFDIGMKWIVWNDFGKTAKVWFNLMVEDDRTRRPKVSVEGIKNGDWVIVTGELKTEGFFTELNDFWASHIEKMK